MECKELIDKELVIQLIPQRQPLVMVDALYDFNPTSVTAGLSIQENNICVKDGYMQESGLIEHMAQSVALHTGYDYYLRKEATPTGYIGSIKKIEIKKLPKIGDKLYTHVEIIQEFIGVTLVEIQTLCEEEIIAIGQMKTVIVH